VAHGVVRGFEPVHVDIGSHDLSVVARRAIDLPRDRSQPGAPAACSRQLISSGIFTVPGGLCAVFGCNPAVVAALCSIFRCDPAVVDSSHAAVCGLSTPRVGPRAFVFRALTVARSLGSVEIADCVVTRFSFSVTKLSRDVTLARSHAGLPTANCCQFVSSGIFTIFGGLCAIFGCNLAIIDGSHAAVRSISAARVGPGAFVDRALAVAQCAVPCSSVEVTRCVVTRLGLSVTLLGRNVTLSRSQSGLPTAHCRQLVGPRILAVLGGARAIVRCNLAVVDGAHAAVSSFGAARVGPGTLLRRSSTIARLPISCGPVEITCRVVTRFGLSVAQLGRDVTRSCSQRGVFSVLGGLRTIFGCKLAIIDGLGAIVRSLSAPRCGLGPFVCRALAVARCAVPRGSVEITRGVITRFGLSVTQPGRHVTVLRSQPGLPAPHTCQLVGP
jgi:hypothetical protein